MKSRLLISDLFERSLQNILNSVLLCEKKAHKYYQKYRGNCSTDGVPQRCKLGVGMALCSLSCLHTAIPMPGFCGFGTAIPMSLYILGNLENVFSVLYICF